MVNRNNIGMILFITACVIAISCVLIFKEAAYLKLFAGILGLTGYLLIPDYAVKKGVEQNEDQNDHV
ncbi:hypothetical protein [Metabacillus idriensis]|uniref:hypothetical protein n=1 Tax=Metabacillus idriensis TaxID=324768 RepID=UPI0017489D41|nr:hypothetical protein [Metabacillus idriensis]